jgi:methylated-DNA-protein-cysteine methyltransferase-like protein
MTVGTFQEWGFVRVKSINATEAYPKFYSVIRKIPRGKVASYAQVAWMAGYPGRARMVGRSLSGAAAASKVPWHRVIGASGKIALPKSSESYLLQKTLLVAEGVIFEGDRVSLRKYGWRRDPAPVFE